MASITATLVSPGDNSDTLQIAQVVGIGSSPIQSAAAEAVEALPLSLDKLDALKLMGIPQGLAEALVDKSRTAARRYWIVDNSGSMTGADGKKVICGNDGSKHLVDCSRWQELSDSLRWHYQVSEILGVHTEFRLLNKPKSKAPKKVVVGAPGAAEELDLIIKSDPIKGTPLCAALRTVIAEIQALESELDEADQTVSVIIASDGEASDGTLGDMLETMKPLKDLPCDIVIRLCTDDNAVVDYWNAIDKNLELELDVLDDTAGEGKEVRGFNPWIGYGEALHRVREFGNAPKVCDFADEHKLAIVEAADMVKLILGEQEYARFPDPQLDAKGYLRELKTSIEKLPPIFDASQGKEGKVVPWVDLKEFYQQVLKKEQSV